MRLRSISILSLLPLWICLLCGQLPAQEAPTPAAPMAPVEVPLPAQGPGQGQAQGTAQAPVQAQPGPTLSSSVSSNKQFVVHGADLAVRSAFCIMSEETAGTLGRLLKDEGRYAIPVVVEVKTPPNVNPAEPTVRPRISLMDFGGFHLQLSVQLRNDFRTEDYNRELVRILLAERILRNHKDINTAREKDILPEWLLTGVTQAMEFRSRSRPSVLFAAVFKSGQVYSIDRILAADPKNLDALSRGIYEVSSCALLLTLLDQPDGPLRVTKFLDALAVDDRPDRELLQQHFPTLGASKNSMEKWWTLQMASLATPSAFETMTIKETEEMLDKALTLHFTDRIGEEPADIKAGREGKGILGWLKRDDKKSKDKGPAKPEDAAVAASSAPGTGTSPVQDMRVSNNASSALPVEGTPSDIPPPLGRPVPGSDLPPLPSSLAPSSAPPPSPDAPPMPPAPETPSASASGTPAPAPAPAPTDAAASTPPADSPKEKDKEATAPAPAPEPADKAEADTKPKKEAAAPEPAQEKPKPRRTAPKPAAKPAEPKPAAATPEKPGTAPAPAAQDGKDKPADPAKPADAPPEEKKRFRFPKIFGGKDVTYTIMLLAMAAVVENAANANAKEDPKAKPPEEATPALPRNNRRVGSRPAGVPEAPKPAAAPTPAPTPAPAPKPAAPAPAANPAEAAPATADEAAADEKKSGRFNPLKWFKREDKKEEAADATAPTPTDADKPASKPNRTRASAPAPEQPVELPSEATRVTSRSSAPKIKPELAAIEDYRRIWKRSDREAILNRNLAILNALKTRSHPLYQPLVDDYATVVQQLVNGKDRGAADKLETLRQRRMQIQGKAKSVESFLDWYEASETQSYSNLFDDYLKLRERLERERTQRPDELSRYLDALEKEYE